MSDATRFWSQVRRETGDGCWIWAGKKNRGGYGDFVVKVNGKYKHVLAHRWAWAEVKGPIPRGLFVLHHCDTPACVRSEADGLGHTFLGTQQDNVDDMMRKGRKKAPAGEAHYMSRIGPEEVREIRRLVNVDGLTRQSVGDRFGLSGASVDKIARGKSWTSVPMETPVRTGGSRHPKKKESRNGIGPPGTIWCGRCREWKSVAEFSPSMVARNAGYCRPCFAEYARTRYAKKSGA